MSVLGPRWSIGKKRLLGGHLLDRDTLAHLGFCCPHIAENLPVKASHFNQLFTNAAYLMFCNQLLPFHKVIMFARRAICMQDGKKSFQLLKRFTTSNFHPVPNVSDVRKTGRVLGFKHTIIKLCYNIYNKACTLISGSERKLL